MIYNQGNKTCPFTLQKVADNRVKGALFINKRTPFSIQYHKPYRINLRAEDKKRGIWQEKGILQYQIDETKK